VRPPPTGQTLALRAALGLGSNTTRAAGARAGWRRVLRRVMRSRHRRLLTRPAG